ncbi:enoyl-CoA hydratase-related protein [Xanthobacter sp. V3C-3]|uniref:enoyl-CoA hydratase/isomerase family protein n=1 Tax=Xanthobacter lutulentifluminis TaxID=3119935 RepID=UPI00372BF81C
MTAPALSLSALELSWPRRGVALVRLTREREMNTLSLPLIAELGQAIDAALDGRARVLVITGTGRAFCCGAHLKYFAGPDAIFRERFETRDRYFEPIARLFDRIEAIGIPVIAAVNGFAMGGGFELALACDFRILADTARVGLPEARLGATPGAGGVQKLARHIGRGKALEWILLARHVEAAEAAALGLAYRVVPAGQVEAESLALAATLMDLSPLALAQCKASVHLAGDVDLRSARRYGVEALSALVDSADWREGMAAFVEKRAPAFAPRSGEQD